MQFHLTQAETLEKIDRVRVHGEANIAGLRREAASFVEGTDSVLDCGRSLRDQLPEVSAKARSFEILDYTEGRSKPTIIFDLCENSLPKNLLERFDKIFCFSILEHVGNPISAARNLYGMLKPGGQIFGYVPFLFPYHSGRGFGRREFPDLWRFSADSLGILFSDASEIEAFPIRGQLGTGIMIALVRGGRNTYKSLEHKYPALGRLLNKVQPFGSARWQCSGYDFIIRKSARL